LLKRDEGRGEFGNGKNGSDDKIREMLNGNEISDADLEKVAKGKKGPKIHVVLEASKKEDPGDLTQELNQMGAELPEKKKESGAAFPWWAILLIVLLVLAILAAIIVLAVYMKKKRQKEPPKKKKIKGAVANIQAKRGPHEYKALSAGYIDEIANMGEQEEADNPTKGTHSDFPTLKEAKKEAKKMAKINKSSKRKEIGRKASE